MFGAKVSNLLLAEKNIIDFVDKNLGQEKERLVGNELELDPVCHHLHGGILDFPAAISHDFCDITTAFDIYVESFTRDATSKLPPKFGSGIFQPPPLKNERLSKMPFRGDELSERQFANAIVQSSIKIRVHIIDCMEECTSSGRLENLYVIISNVAMIRNYIWMFLQIFNLEEKSRGKLKGEYDEHGELVEVISDRMLQCQMNLLTTYIIHDEVSQNWSSSHSYYEGQRGSPTIHMWAYFLQGAQRDMWKIMPPQLAQRILAILLNDSLGILTARYSKIEPSDETRIQFCADTLNILETVEKLLCNVSQNLDQFSGNVDPSTSKAIFSIHLKCRCLVTSLVLVGTPLEVLYKTFRRGLSNCGLLEKPTNTNRNTVQAEKPIWMSVLSTLCPKYQPSTGVDDWELLSTLRLLCAQPSINWALVYKAISMNEFRLGTLVLQQFFAVVAPPTDFLLEGKGFSRCLKAGCISGNCHSLPKYVANHFVSSSILYIFAHTIPRGQLVKIYHSILPHVEDWSVMDRTQVWTSTKRPVWFQSLIDLLLPMLKTCVQGLCVSFLTVRKGDEDSTGFVVELLNYLTEILSIIPRGFFLICEEIDDLIPPSSVYPVRNNVPVHFLVTTLYHLLNLSSGIISSAELILNSSVPQRTDSSSTAVENQDVKNVHHFLLSTSERLCHLDDSVFDQAIHRLISQIESMMRQTQAETGKRGLGSEFVVTNDLAALKANFILEEIEGQIALRNVSWFLVTHGDSLQDALCSTNEDYGVFAADSAIGATEMKKEAIGHKYAHSSKVAPTLPKSPQPKKAQDPITLNSLRSFQWTRTYHKPPNTVNSFHFVNKYRTFDEIVWNFNENLDWVSTIRNCKMGLHKPLILRQLERRPDFQSANEIVPPVMSTENSSERAVLMGKMVTEIKALMS